MRYVGLLVAVVIIVLFCGNLRALQEFEDEPIYDDAILQPVYYEKLEYPQFAEMAQIQGVVVVRAKYDMQGRVISAALVSGPKLLVSASLENIKKWRFQPNPKTPANSVVIVYDFRLEGYCVSFPCDSLFTFRPRNIATIVTGRPLIDHGPTW